MERILINALKTKYGVRCLNISPGGQGGEGIKWTKEQRDNHKILLNQHNVKERMKISQTIAQNRIERKLRQSEIMKEFYTNGGAQEVSKATSKAQRIAPHWHEPLKSEIRELWLSLGKPTQGVVAKALSGKYEVTASQLKLLIYEFKDVINTPVNQ